MDIKTKSDGYWSNPSIWEGGKLPSAADRAIINHPIILNQDATVAGIEVNAELRLALEKDITLQSSKNIVVNGIMSAFPQSGFNNTIRFIDVDENKFIGGGHDVLDTDIGLWVMGAGRLDLQGTPKTSWTNEVDGIIGSSNFLEVKESMGWREGDELMITPTAKDAFNYEIANIVELGDVITLNKGISNHPLIDNLYTAEVANLYTAEVANLTRNIRIEGAATGQSHIFIKSTTPQILRYVALRHMGPRKQQRGTTVKEFIVGRYALHFHHCGHIDGTVIEGCVARDCGSHVFVPHGSHGIHFLHNVTYNTFEHAFWYDPGHSTHNNKWNHNLVARLNYVPGAINMSLAETDPDTPPTFSAGGFMLGEGDGNECVGNVVVGAVGDPHDGGGFQWPARDENKNEGIWVFKDNLAHNCSTGLQVWQNTVLNHIVENYQAYSNTLDIFHGAYANSYRYLRGRCNGLVEFKAASANSSRVRVEDMELSQVDLLPSPLAGDLPMLFLNCRIGILTDKVTDLAHSADLINCTGTFKVAGSSREVLRVQQPDGTAYKITTAGKSAIAPFAPTIWGTGTGLKGEYFADATFTKKVLERIDSYIGFSEWGNGIHHLLTPVMSARWTGFIEPQFNETYTFITQSAGIMKLLIDEKQVVGPVSLVAGKRYPIRVEFSNADTDIRGGVNLGWICPSLTKFCGAVEYVPQCQLYAGQAANKPPVASAGEGKTLLISLDLDGSGSDTDGTVVSYWWEKISGPECVIMDASSAKTKAVYLQPGTYVFRLTVTDDKGATGMSQVTHVVKE
jgi:hypothetical protein